MATESQVQRNGFFSLDPTSALYLFSFLGPQDLCSAAMVCREWRSTANDPSLWRDLLESNPKPMLSGHDPLCLVSPSHTTSCQLATQSSFVPTWLEVPSSSPLSSPVVGARQLAASNSGRVRQVAGHGRGYWDLADQGLCQLAARGPVEGAQVATYKQVYRISEAWRRGKARAKRLVAKGSDKASAVRIAPSGQRLVMASGGRGSCLVFDAQTGKRCAGCGLSGSQEPEDPAYEDLHGLYACSAISGDCETVGFGGFDGTILVYDVTGGKLRATLGGIQHRAAAQSLAISWDGSLVAAGLSDGHLALGRTRQLATSDPAQTKDCRRPGLRLDCSENADDVASSDWWMVRQLGTGLAVTCLEPNLAGCGQGPDRNYLAVGTSGGHVMVVDGETGDKKASMVGSCSCPVASLCIHSERKEWFENPSGKLGSSQLAGVDWDSSGQLVYAAFSHHTTGNGHSNAVFVWDIATAERVALLYPGGGGGARQTRGGRGVGFMSGSPVKSVFADGYKVVVTAGKSATVFETRTWQVLYELSVSHRVLREGEVGAEEEEETAEREGGEERDTDWFWNLAEGEGMGGANHVTARGIESCISPRPAGELDQFPGFSPRVVLESPSVSRFGNVHFGSREETSSYNSDQSPRSAIGETGSSSRSLSLDMEGHSNGNTSEQEEDVNDVHHTMSFLAQPDLAQPDLAQASSPATSTPPPTPASEPSLQSQEVFFGFPDFLSSPTSRPWHASSSHPLARSNTLREGQAVVGSWSDSRSAAFPASRHGKLEHPILAANQRRILIRTNSDGDLRANLCKASPKRDFEAHTDEPANQRAHFLGPQLAMPLKGGAVGLVTFASSRLADGSADIHVTPRLVT